MSLVVDAHRQYLSDAARLGAFERAIAATVHPGDVVLDLGSGTGILGLLACRAGASRVYAVESDGMIEVARAIARENGVSDRITFVMQHSSELQLPEPCDVLVGDLIGRMGFEAGVFEAYAHVARWLKPAARVIPSEISIHAAPVEHREAHADVERWNEPVAGFRTASVLPWARNTGYPRDLDRRHLLSAATVSGTFSPMAGAPLLRVKGCVEVSREGRIHGIGTWFSARLAPGVSMTNAPGNPARINRRNVFLPLEGGTEVRAGDTVTIDLRIRPVDFVVSWDVGIDTAGGVQRVKHSTLGGMLLTREDLRSHDPASRPHLKPRGEARRTLLALCDGNHTLAEIERGVFARHRDLFAAEGDAQAFVAEVVARYGAFE